MANDGWDSFVQFAKLMGVNRKMSWMLIRDVSLETVLLGTQDKF